MVEEHEGVGIIDRRMGLRASVMKERQKGSS